MDTGSKRPTSVYYILMTLGMLCLALLGIWLSCLITLREEMSISQSPMVGGAPFLNIFFIFLFAWLSYAFFGAAAADKRTSEGRSPIRWGTSAFWFAVAISALSTHYYMLQPEPEPEYVGFICPLSGQKWAETHKMASALEQDGIY